MEVKFETFSKHKPRTSLDSTIHTDYGGTVSTIPTADSSWSNPDGAAPTPPARCHCTVRRIASSPLSKRQGPSYACDHELSLPHRATYNSDVAHTTTATKGPFQGHHRVTQRALLLSNHGYTEHALPHKTNNKKTIMNANIVIGTSRRERRERGRASFDGQNSVGGITTLTSSTKI
jgi:hypothetical protein